VLPARGPEPGSASGAPGSVDREASERSMMALMGGHDLREELSTVLALDTTGSLASVALVRPGSGPEMVAAPAGSRPSGVLHGLLFELLSGPGGGASEGAPRPGEGLLAGVELVAAVRGPGSFTGLRVGLAAAAGLALAGRVPSAGIETTAAVAAASGAEGPVLVLLEGGQGRLFLGLHEMARGLPEPVRGPEDVDLDAASSAVRRHRGTCLVRGRPPGLERRLEAGARAFEEPLAAAAAALALRPDRREPLSPLYLRAPAIRPRSGAGR